jgi:protein-S-isoprenylcysteine O-methyltransferase Ste14
MRRRRMAQDGDSMSIGDDRFTAGSARPSSAAEAAAWGGAVLFAASMLFFLYRYFVSFGRPVGSEHTAVPIAANLGLFSTFALHHSVMARTGAKTWLRRRIAPYMERSLYVWVSSALFILVCGFWQHLPGLLYSLPGPLALAGYGIQLAGVWLTIRGAGAIDALDLAGVRPVLLARDGSPPRHVALETRGAYSIVRHPVYLAWTLLVFGAPEMTATRAVFAVTSTAYLMLAVPFEERSLIEVFGADYEAYRRKVRWRMVPGIY